MPETPNPKLRETPPPGRKSVARSSYGYAELDVKTNFSFLCGASHADELVYRAAELGYRAIGITDVNTLSGVVRAHEAAKEMGLKLLVGSRLTFSDAPDLLVWASNRSGYARLCRMLTIGKRRTEKGECDLKLEDFLNDNEGLVAAVEGNVEKERNKRTKGKKGLPPLPVLRERVGVRVISSTNDSQSSKSPSPLPSPGGPGEGVAPFSPLSLCPSVPLSLSSSVPLSLLHSSLGSRLSLIAACSYGADDVSYLRRLAELSRQTGIPLLATNAVHYHDPSRRMLQDVLTCVRQGCTIHEAGFRLFPNGERYLKSPRQMHRLFADYPQALRRGLEIAEQCDFQLDSLRYEYPDELVPAGKTPIEHLSDLAWAGAAGHYPDGIPRKVHDLLDHELKLIAQLKFEAYFLTVHDLVSYARSRGILCQGRGSAANSAVCFCIGVTSVNPVEVDLLFERFISAARNEPPDIDIDFEHERREEVIQYIYEKYGRERAGMTAEVITYRGRSAVRDVGKAMGLSLDMVDSMASKLDWWHRGVLSEPQLRECGLDPADSTIRQVITLATELLGFPRHLSQHVGGMVMTRGPLCELVPIENASMPDRTVIEWDKNDIDSLGILKVDVLALGMLTCISKAFGLIEGMGEGTEARRHEGTKGEEGKGTEARRHEDTKGDEGGIFRSVGVEHDVAINQRGSDNSNSSRSDCLATRDATGQKHVRSDPVDAENRAVRIDRSDAPGNGIDPLKHCRGVCTPEQDRLYQIPENCAGITRRAVDPIRTVDRPEAAGRESTDHESVGRNRPRSPRSHPQPATQVTTSPSSPSCLRAFVPSCLPLSLSSFRPTDPAVYEMISNADTIGVFQIESRAQMSMLPRLRPNCFYDLVIEVAIVRPGPIQGNMVHPYLRRRCGEEQVAYPSEALHDVLHKTLGVPLFQEQAMRIAMVAAGFSAEEADKLRRAMAAWRRSTALEAFHLKIVNGMLANGYEREFAEQCFNQIKGFGEYGFPESHAASFALLVYVSAWLKRYHPAAFAAALINSQPMGFYMPAQIVRDAKEHGVKVLPVDVNESDWDCTLEEKDDQKREHATPSPGTPGEGRGEGDFEHQRLSTSQITLTPTLSRSTGRGSDAMPPKQDWGIAGPWLRLGFRQFKGFREAHAGLIVDARRKLGRFRSIEQFHQTTGLPVTALRLLAEGDAFGSLGLSRREALWQVLPLKDEERGLFEADGEGTEARRHEGTKGEEGEVVLLPTQGASTLGVREAPSDCLERPGCLHPGSEGLPAAETPRTSPTPQTIITTTSPSSPSCLHPPTPLLPPMPLGQEVMTDYATAGLSLKQHPVALVREELKRRKILRSVDLNPLLTGRWVKVAGLVLIRQRPGTASGIVFETLEDETGIVNLIVKPDIYERYRPAARHAGLLQADGYLQKQGQVVHVIAKRLFDLSDLLQGQEFHSRDFH